MTYNFLLTLKMVSSLMAIMFNVQRGVRLQLAWS